MADGPDIFVVGASRSGTTWVQAVLACHPDVVTTNETRVIDALERAGRYHGPRDETGLHHLLDDDEFDEWRRDLWQRCRRALLSARPEATRVLEKTPSHGRNIDLIRRISPGSRIVVVVRDPRAVVRSLVERRRIAGRTWAPRTVKEATDAWLGHVRDQLAACGDDTLVVRQEDLVADPSRFDTIVEFVGLDLDRWTRPDTTASPATLPGVNALTRRDGTWTPCTLAHVPVTRSTTGRPLDAVIAGHGLRRVGLRPGDGATRVRRWTQPPPCGGLDDDHGIGRRGPDADRGHRRTAPRADTLRRYRARRVERCCRRRGPRRPVRRPPRRRPREPRCSRGSGHGGARSERAGKTSTIEVCEGFRRASGGTVRVLGHDPSTEQRALSERMGVMLRREASTRVLDRPR